MSSEPPLLRPKDGRMIAGVCAGAARRLEMNAAVVRGVFVLLLPLGIVAYVLGWLFIEEE
jgi:phage shock protein PspC (stress-responsive transcriptional regulator)